MSAILTSLIDVVSIYSVWLLLRYFLYHIIRINCGSINLAMVTKTPEKAIITKPKSGGTMGNILSLPYDLKKNFPLGKLILTNIFDGVG